MDNPRKVVLVVNVDDDAAVAEDKGTLDYLYQQLDGVKGVEVVNARVLDDDDPEDWAAIDSVNDIFGSIM